VKEKREPPPHARWRGSLCSSERALINWGEWRALTRTVEAHPVTSISLSSTPHKLVPLQDLNPPPTPDQEAAALRARDFWKRIPGLRRVVQVMSLVR